MQLYWLSESFARICEKPILVPNLASSTDLANLTHEFLVVGGSSVKAAITGVEECHFLPFDSVARRK